MKFMNGPKRLIYWSIIFFISWALLVTSAAYVNCENVVPDQFLDVAFGCQKSHHFFLAVREKTSPAFLGFLNTIKLKRSDFLTVVLRC